MSKRYVDRSPTFEAKLEKSGDRFLVRGIHQQADVKNQNGRIYPRSLWENILRPGHQVQKKLTERRMLGLLGHPPDGKIDDKMERISHVTTELFLRPDLIVEGATELFPTPSGNVGKTLFQCGVKLGISSRGYGDAFFRNDGGAQVEVLEDEFGLDGFDFVLDPSVATAFPGVVNESVEREVSAYTDLMKVVNERLAVEMTDKVREELSVYRNILNEYIADARPTKFYERSGRLSQNGLLFEDVKSLIEKIDDRSRISFVDSTKSGSASISLTDATGQKLTLKSDSPIYISPGVATMAHEVSPDVSRLEARIEEIGKAKEEKIKQLTTDNESKARQVEALRRRNAAAEQLLTAATKKIKDLHSQLESSKALVKAGVRRVRKESRHRVNLSAKLSKSESLLAEAVSKLTSSKKAELESYRRSLASRLPDAKGAYELLSRAESIEEMNRTYRQLRSFGEAQRGGKQVTTESRKVRTALPKHEQKGKPSTMEKKNPASDLKDEKKAPKLEQVMTRKLLDRVSRHR